MKICKGRDDDLLHRQLPMVCGVSVKGHWMLAAALFKKKGKK